MVADIATLLAEAPWLARLARSLTGDAAEADDIVQEAYAAALDTYALQRIRRISSSMSAAANSPHVSSTKCLSAHQGSSGLPTKSSINSRKRARSVGSPGCFRARQ